LRSGSEQTFVSSANVDGAAGDQSGSVALVILYRT